MMITLLLVPAWDPDNLFQHCQSVGSSPASGQTCCPGTAAAAAMTAGSCVTSAGTTCTFPFTWQGVAHSSCTTAGGHAPWCSTLTSGTGEHVTGHYGTCGDTCAREEDCSTVR